MYSYCSSNHHLFIQRVPNYCNPYEVKILRTITLMNNSTAADHCYRDRIFITVIIIQVIIFICVCLIFSFTTITIASEPCVISASKVKGVKVTSAVIHNTFCHCTDCTEKRRLEISIKNFTAKNDNVTHNK